MPRMRVRLNMQSQGEHMTLRLKLAGAAVPAALMAAAPAFAHNEGVLHAAGFAAGFMHPLSGLDHLLAMVAVGWWATQNQRRALWMLPLAFSIMLMTGLILGISGIRIPIVESGIAGSVLALGLLIAFAVRLPVKTGAALIGGFALLHGQAHGIEMQAGTSAGMYAAGLILATLALHVTGMLAGRAAFSNRVARLVGAAVAATGAWLLAFA